MREVRHQSELGRWHMASARPDARLAGQVLQYTSYEVFERGLTARREVPTGTVTVIIGLGGPIDVGYPLLGDGRARPFRSFATGLHTAYAVVDSHGAQAGVDVKLTPLGAHVLLGLPMHELADTVIPLDDVLGPVADCLAERLDELEDPRSRFAVLDRFLLGRLSAARAPAPDVTWAWRQLEATGGRARVETLASELRCSRRHLSSRFREQVGLPPKAVARVLRFQRAVSLLGDDDGRRFAEIAAACGYYDQPHMDRDFRIFAGGSPRDFLARRLPDRGGIVHG